MTRSTWTLGRWCLGLAATVGLVVGLACNESELPGADGAVANDVRTADATAVDRSGSTDSVSTVDTSAAVDRAAAPDRAPALDTSARPDAMATPDRGPRPDMGPSPGCAGVTCALANDCCSCKAYNPVTTKPPACSITGCKQPTCGALFIRKPVTYCVKGRCLMGDNGIGCTRDSDCMFVSNCCDCLALPRGTNPPVCPIATCLVPHCQSIGLPSAKAKCVGGVCRLQP